MADEFEERIPQDAESALYKIGQYFHPDDLKARSIEFNDIRLAVSILERAKEFEPVIAGSDGDVEVCAVLHTACGEVQWPVGRVLGDYSLFELLMIAREHKCPAQDEES